MDNKNQWNTDLIWSILMNLLSTIILLVVVALIFFAFQNDIYKILNQPRYDKEWLAEKTKERMQSQVDDWDRVENGIHVKTGMIYDKNFKFIRSHCLSCHSSKMITQNSATRDGWKQMIRWMQATQGLHDLGNDEEFILDYLSTHYAPTDTGRRPNLDIEAIEWYVLNLD